VWEILGALFLAAIVIGVVGSVLLDIIERLR